MYEENASNLFHPAGFYSIYAAAAASTSSTETWNISYYLVKYTDTDVYNRERLYIHGRVQDGLEKKY